MATEKHGSRQFTFSRGFEWTPPEAPRSVIVYKAGHTYGLRRICADAALAAGAGAFAGKAAASDGAAPTDAKMPAEDMADELKVEAPQADVAEGSGL